MRRNQIALIVASLLVLPAAVFAQQPATSGPSSAPVGPPPAENVSYGYADVLRADPIYQRVIYREPEERCEDDVVYERVDSRAGGNTAGTVLGAIVGGAVGNQIGSGSGRVAATVGGAVVGGAVGNRAGGNRGGGYRGEEVRPGCRIVEVERENRELVGYEVEYRHKGDVYISRLNHDPGQRLQVRVAVSPVNEPALGER